ncbi:hypothetical protein Tco_1508669 [Tanacetum coccineum]
MNVSPIPTTRIHKDHPKDQIIGDINSATQTRKMTKISEEHVMVLDSGRSTKGKRILELSVKRAFNQKSAAKTNKFNEKVNTARVNNVTTARPKAVVSAAKGKGGNVVKSSACWIWRPTGNVIDHTSKDIGSYMLKRFDYVDLQGRLNGCSRHMTGNKSFLTDYQEIDGGFVAFGGSPKGASTLIETNKALLKDEEAEDVDVHLYRSMIGSLMYLTASRPDIMFAVCACARDSPFDLEAFSDSDYAGASLDRKSTTGGCQFLRKRLISWQCKKQTIVANSTTEAEYVAGANCCGQVLWIQNQMLDYGFNFMSTKIYIDNESTICIVKNPVFHSKTKHIKIRHHFIRDSYKKKLIQLRLMRFEDDISDEYGVKTDSCKFNDARQDLVLLGKS